jgi:hypothetical protein
MRTTLKIVLPLIVSVAVVSLLFAAYQVRTERRNLRNDLSRRAEILGDSLQETVEPLLGNGPSKNLQRLVARFGQREHLQGVAVYDVHGEVIAVTTGSPLNFRRALRPRCVPRNETRVKVNFGRGAAPHPETKSTWARCISSPCHCTATGKPQALSSCFMTRAISTRRCSIP